jgi:hypothetical protein
VKCYTLFRQSRCGSECDDHETFSFGPVGDCYPLYLQLSQAVRWKFWLMVASPSAAEAHDFRPYVNHRDGKLVFGVDGILSGSRWPFSGIIAKTDLNLRPIRPEECPSENGCFL